ncbi:MAG: hypothetical protein ACRC2T_03470, partial [Thermoguttaceae bacterium]
IAGCKYVWQILHGGRAGIDDVWLYFWFYGLCVLIIDLLCSVQKSEVPFTEKWNPILRGFGYACILFLIVFIGENDVQPFIYFQF